MKNRKSFFYIKGSISLMFLLFLGILFLFKNNPFQTYGAMVVVYYNRDMEKLMGFTLEEFLETKKFTNIVLTGNEINDKKLLDSFQIEVRKLVLSKDSIKGVHLKLNKKTKYGEFIKAIEICKVEKASIYAPYEDNIWVTFPSTESYKKSYRLQKRNHN